MSRKEFIADAALALRQMVYEKSEIQRGSGAEITRVTQVDTLNALMAVKEAIFLADALEKTNVAPWIA